MRREVQAAVLALGLVGLLLVIAFAARGGHPTSSGHATPRIVPETIQDSVVTLVVIAYALAIVVILLLFAYRRPWQQPDSHWLRNFVSLMVLMAIATVIGSWALKHAHRGERAERTEGLQQQQQQPHQAQPPSARPVPPRAAHFQWPLAVGVAGLIVVGGVLLFIREWRPRPKTTFEGTVEEEVAQALETAIEDLERERDARRVVIAAYARMERVLASHGLVRHGAETPFEYLARILRQLRVRENAVVSLTQLFEYAKFSPHEIDAVMKEQAIAALTAVRDDLRRDEAIAA